MERYRVYSKYLFERYGEKVYKLPVNLPLTCPNRDGTIGMGGCAFCGDVGAGFECLPAAMTVEAQLRQNREYIGKKYGAKKFIAYFQNFSNTYLAPVDFYSYLEAAALPDVVALAIATRPDCVSDAHLAVLREVCRLHRLDATVELGLQTANYHTLDAIHRGHGLAEFIDAVLRVKRSGFDVCAHVILNLPGDELRDVVETAKVLSALQVEQVKVHALYIVRGTEFARRYEAGELQPIAQDEYVERVVSFLEYLHPDIVVQRLLGRAPAQDTLFSNWGTAWWRIRDEIELRMEQRDSRQGRLCNFLNGPAVQKFL